MSDDQIDPAQLLRDADLALFRAKKAGVDRVETFRASMRLEADDRVAGVEQLRKAMDRKQIFVLYQPIYQLKPERLAGFEAVIRWEHPLLGPMGQLDFMPIAERGGFAVALATQIIEQAIKDAVTWQKTVPRETGPLFVNVNVGGTMPLQPDMVQELRTLLGRYALPKGCLRLEVSDAAITDNPERAAEVLDWLRNAGAGIVLGEFGAGRFPLGYLPRLAVDAIKLDRWLCFEALADNRGSGLIRGLTALARELDRAVIADAMESAADVATLRAAGCTLGLGPFYGDPLTDRQLGELLSAVRKAERKSERRGLLGGGLLSRSRKSVAAAASQPGAARPALSPSAQAAGSRPANGYAATHDDVPAEYGDALTAAELASAYAAVADDQARQAPPLQPTAMAPEPQIIISSDTPTIIAPALPMPAGNGVAPASNESPSGLARLQRGQFGARFGNGLATPEPARPVTPPGELDLPPKPASWSDALPDPEVLRGLAERLQAALRRDGN